MYKFKHLIVILGSICFSCAALCPPLGPLLPRPRALATSHRFQDATRSLSSLFTNVTKDNLSVPWEVRNVSFSVSLVALPRPGCPPGDVLKPIWEFHHLAEANVNGTKRVDGDSQYLVGSISKVFTDLLLLKTDLNRNDPITKYLPDLDGESYIQWRNITLDNLGDHLAGMPPTYGFPEIYPLVQYFELLGFPVLAESEFPDCGIIGLNPGCTKQQLLKNLKEAPPIAAPNLRPIYSSLSFTLLSYAMQNATGRNYSQLLDGEIIKPLNLKNTGVSPGNDDRAVIPNVELSSWGSDYGDNAPGGGLYSSTNDLSTLVTSLLDPNFPTPILSRSRILSWLQPHSATSSLQTLVGLPWEIYRTANLTPEHPHTIDLYTKGGAAIGYAAEVGLIDQYGLGWVILTAGAKGVEAQLPLREAILATILPVVEDVARKEAEDRYTGNWTVPSGKTPGTISLKIDSGPGVRITELSRNESDMLAAMKTLWNAQPAIPGKLADEFRLYPTDVSKEVNDTIEEEWRLGWEFQYTGYGNSSLPVLSEREYQCTGWMASNAIMYGGEGVDRFVFVKKDEEVVEIRVPALRMILTAREL